MIDIFMCGSVFVTCDQNETDHSSRATRIEPCAEDQEKYEWNE